MILHGLLRHRYTMSVLLLHVLHRRDVALGQDCRLLLIWLLVLRWSHVDIGIEVGDSGVSIVRWLEEA